ncbi:helix-turn-helix transcriptional regulator [Methylobacterium segetis]|uniref:helix-turn-helix transcriptional regulator n=1 Tax=Methylobacterium segetis TaxID=2488750 RepID=UPI0014049FD9|nr:helix-turn-helix transcriptional regulator [Methylobacterium segetis]
MEIDSGGLVDHIYEAAVIPEMWPNVLSQLMRFGGGDGALLFTTDGNDFRYVTSPGFEAGTAEYVAEGWPARTDRAARLFAKQHAGFLTDLDVYTAEEMETEPVFRDFLRPRGFGWGVASAITVPSGDRLIFNVERAFSRGPITGDIVARLDTLRPHLARAATMSARLRLQTVKVAAQVLDVVNIPAAILGWQAQVLAVNDGCSALLGSTIREARRLTLNNPKADRLLAPALETLAAKRPTSICSIPIPATEERGPLILHVLPVRRAAADLFNAASAIVIFTPVALGEAPDLTVLSGLFDLTGAEARVARELTACRTVEEIAAQAGVSVNTIRTQLKSVLAKTGTRRQAELVGLLAGMAPTNRRRP